MRRMEFRLRKLETELKLRNQPQCMGLACVWHYLPFERKKNLGPGERVVVDWYRNHNAQTYGRERITDDPADQGHKCKVGGYLLNVLEELHRNCSRRDSTGSCGDCKGTPVAGTPAGNFVTELRGGNESR